MWQLPVAILALLSSASAQDPNCDYYQSVQAGTTYYVQSPNYPNNYGRNLQCRWIATAPSGYNVRLECPEIVIPQSASCSQDRLMVSRTGDPQLNAADPYCGTGTLTVDSVASTMSIGLVTSSTTQGGRFFCRLYATPATSQPSSCQCGYKKSNRIVGGQETGVNEFPMMGALVNTATADVKCGCTIIDKRWVVTAAHCVAGQNINNWAVAAGEHDVTTGSDTNALQILRISQFIIHPNYNPNTYDYDIALVRLSSDIIFNDRVGPACLPFKYVGADLTGRTLTALGWGTTFFGGPKSDTLQKVDLPVISQSSCRSSVSTLTNRQLCTFARSKDACQDDSGGPLLYTDPSTGLLFHMAIISYGKACATGTPGVGTRMTEMISWIQANTPNVNYCRK